MIKLIFHHLTYMPKHKIEINKCKWTNEENKRETITLDFYVKNLLKKKKL